MIVCACCKERKHSNKFIIKTKLLNREVLFKVCDDCGTEEHLKNYTWKNKMVEEGALSGYSIGPTQFSNCYKQYGIDIKVYNQMYNEQEGKCKICKRHQSEFTKRLAVDHCHKTGKVRGLLCHGCNAALGLLKENKQSVIQMVLYIQQNE